MAQTLCCNSFPDISNKSIEITEEQYQGLSEDVYHFLRISPGSKISWQKSGNRFYIRFNSLGEGSGPAYASEQIVPRMQALSDWLSNAELPPVLVTICRSVHSGYTPKAEVEDMQALVLKQLNALWPIRELTLCQFAEVALRGA